MDVLSDALARLDAAIMVIDQNFAGSTGGVGDIRRSREILAGLTLAVRALSDVAHHLAERTA